MKRVFKRFAALSVALMLLFAAGCDFSQPTQDFSGQPQKLDIGSPYKFHYDRLDDTEKHAYNAVLECIETFPTEVEVPILTQQQLKNFYTALLYDNPVLFFLGNTPTVRQNKKKAMFQPQYIMGREDYEAMLHKCNVAAETIRIQAQAQDTQFGQELVMHDLLVAQCKYNEKADNQYKNSIYGALSSGSAACEGYAKTAKYILDQLSIPNYLVTGNSTPPGAQTQAHMWNLVQIEGEWYHLDLTWDDPVLEKGGDIISHTYFNVTDAQIGETHTEYRTDSPCTATEQNYFVHEHLNFRDYGVAEKARTVEIASEMLALGSGGFQLNFATQYAYDRAKKTLFENEGIYDILQKIKDASEVEFATDRVSYFCTDSNFTIEIIVVE